MLKNLLSLKESSIYGTTNYTLLIVNVEFLKGVTGKKCGNNKNEYVKTNMLKMDV